MKKLSLKGKYAMVPNEDYFIKNSSDTKDLHESFKNYYISLLIKRIL